MDCYGLIVFWEHKYKGMRHILETSYNVTIFAACSKQLCIKFQELLVAKEYEILYGQSLVSLLAHGRTGRVSPSHYPPIPVRDSFSL